LSPQGPFLTVAASVQPAVFAVLAFAREIFAENSGGICLGLDKHRRRTKAGPGTGRIHEGLRGGMGRSAIEKTGLMRSDPFRIT